MSNGRMTSGNPAGIVAQDMYYLNEPKIRWKLGRLRLYGLPNDLVLKIH
ncbi:10648_t:CDS:2 [Rhizophagus irregularis]|nr:10648_t:CDS:2 [Rhizophagus irregularis]